MALIKQEADFLWEQSENKDNLRLRESIEAGCIILTSKTLSDRKRRTRISWTSKGHYNSASSLSPKNLGIFVWLLPYGTRQCMWIFHFRSSIDLLICIEWIRRCVAFSPLFPCGRSKRFDAYLFFFFYHFYTWLYQGLMLTERKKVWKWADLPKR